jgi:hypothetical protein
MLFASGFSEGMQSDNFTDELRARGATQPTPVHRVYDVNTAVGGPILRDRLWFYLSIRRQGQRQNILNVFHNQNAGDPTAWTYVPDLNRPAFYDRTWENYTPRVTWQATDRNKFSFSWDEQPICRNCSGTASFSGSPSGVPTSPEADGRGEFSPQRIQTGTVDRAGDQQAAARGWVRHQLLPVGGSRAQPEPGPGSGARVQHRAAHHGGRHRQDVEDRTF